MVSVAEGAIVGTYFKIDGDVASPVDSKRVGRLIRIVREIGFLIRSH